MYVELWRTEEEVNVWCDPFDPCGYLVILCFHDGQ